MDTEVPEDNVERQYAATLQADHLYRLEVTCGGGVAFTWTNGFGFTLLSNEVFDYFKGGTSTVFFYVPTDTQTVGFYAQAGTTVKLFDATGAQVGDTIEAHFDYHAVEVPQSRGGAVWQISGVNAKLGLLTVPPGFALAPEELLVPREVAEQDGLLIIP